MDDSEQLVIRPLGAGQEVGRSCIMLEFKGKKIMLDCGIHPGLSGMDALPFVDTINAAEVDLLLVSHFHLDHCGSLPWFLQKTAFKGRCFMTHATKAIYRWLLADYIKVSNIATDQMLYTESDLEATMDKIETIDFHERRDVRGVKFWAYHAGHVLGAAMFMMEIAGVKVLYTGDFSRQEDRHLMVAEIPTERPDVLIIESTYGTHVHEKREQREQRFTGVVHEIVQRGGRCLIPVFALGRAQELQLILDEYWSLHPQLHDVPIYYASSLAKKCMAVYQTYVNAMNERIRQQIAVNNPFIFKHIQNLRGIDHFEDVGPCVIMASPGMMQSGLSRELFEAWCTDSRNGVIVAGYCVEGTLAKHLLSEPEEVATMAGHKLPLKMSVDYISFSAHTDYEQSSHFIRQLKPAHIVLVHGEQNVMARLRDALQRELEQLPDFANVQIHSPRNTAAVTLPFRGEQTVKVVGSLAEQLPEAGQRVSGLLVKRHFNYQLLAPHELAQHTDMVQSSVSQRVGVHFAGSWSLLQYVVSCVSADVEVIKQDSSGFQHQLRVFGCISVNLQQKQQMVVLEWVSGPTADMLADAVMAVVLRTGQTEASGQSPTRPPVSDMTHYRECLIELLQEMFGDEAVPRMFKGDQLYVQSGDHRADIDLAQMKVTSEDSELQSAVQTAVTRLYHTLSPAKLPDI